MPDLPHGTVTPLFTDIAGSTAPAPRLAVSLRDVGAPAGVMLLQQTPEGDRPSCLAVPAGVP